MTDKYYITTDAVTGRLTGLFPPWSTAPSGAQEVTLNQFIELRDHEHTRAFLNGQVVDADFTRPPLERYRTSAMSTLEEYARITEARYLTLGKDMIYLLKADQAQAYKDAGYTGTPGDLITHEADAIGYSYQQLADEILATRAAVIPKAGQLEAATRAARIAITAAADHAAIDTALATAKASMDAI